MHFARGNNLKLAFSTPCFCRDETANSKWLFKSREGLGWSFPRALPSHLLRSAVQNWATELLSPLGKEPSLFLSFLRGYVNYIILMIGGTVQTALTAQPKHILRLWPFVLRSTYYFQYDGEIYECQNGAATWGQFSAVIADIFMNYRHTYYHRHTTLNTDQALVTYLSLSSRIFIFFLKECFDMVQRRRKQLTARICW